MKATSVIKSFSNDGEYLDLEIRRYLQPRLSRIEAQRDLVRAEQAARHGDDTHARRRCGVRELRGLIEELAFLENEARAESDRRLHVKG